MATRAELTVNPSIAFTLNGLSVQAQRRSHSAPLLYGRYACGRQLPLLHGGNRR
jgi:hypothetical protein